MSEKKQSKPLMENVVDTVLQDYLDQLLVTATKPADIPVENTDIQSITKTINIDRVKVIEPDISEIEATVVAEPIVAKVAAEEEISVEIIAPAVEEALLGDSDVTAQEMHSTDAASWATTGVECLLFSVSGLKLAVPLPLLGGVHELGEEELTPLFGQPDWYLGIMNTEQGRVQVIDTAKFIMPERGTSLKESGFNYLIQLDKSPWVMGCQSIDDTIRLEASEIKWRGDRGKRPWLAGTVIEKMCALLDVSGLLELVESSCKPVRISRN